MNSSAITQILQKSVFYLICSEKKFVKYDIPFPSLLPLANRTEPNLCDLSQAFRSLSVDLSDLAEFLREVDSQPLDQRVPRFPASRSSTHIYHGPASFGEVTRKRSRAPSLSSEDEEYDHIPPYLPPFPSQRRESVRGEPSIVQTF